VKPTGRVKTLEKDVKKRRRSETPPAQVDHDELLKDTWVNNRNNREAE
jgi:hypothetical protein